MKVTNGNGDVDSIMIDVGIRRSESYLASLTDFDF